MVMKVWEVRIRLNRENEAPVKDTFSDEYVKFRYGVQILFEVRRPSYFDTDESSECSDSDEEEPTHDEKRKKNPAYLRDNLCFSLARIILPTVTHTTVSSTLRSCSPRLLIELCKSKTRCCRFFLYAFQDRESPEWLQCLLENIPARIVYEKILSHNDYDCLKLLLRLEKRYGDMYPEIVDECFKARAADMYQKLCQLKVDQISSWLSRFMNTLKSL